MTAPFTIRPPRDEDIEGIRAVVKACEPLILTYIPYYYWMNVRYFGETCAVAESGGEIAGWFSVIPVPEGKYFVHQLGVHPAHRGKGIAPALVAHVFKKLKNSGAPEIELTIEDNNEAVKRIFSGAAESVGLRLIRQPGSIRVLQDEYNESLYVIREAA